MNNTNKRYHLLINIMLVPLLVVFVYIFGYKIPIDYLAMRSMTYVNTLGYIIVAIAYSIFFLWGLNYNEERVFRIFNYCTILGLVTYFLMALWLYVKFSNSVYLRKCCKEEFHSFYYSIPFVLYMVYFVISTKQQQTRLLSSSKNLKYFILAILNFIAILFVIYFVSPIFVNIFRINITIYFSVIISGFSNFLFMSGIIFSLHNCLLYFKSITKWQTKTY